MVDAEEPAVVDDGQRVRRVDVDDVHHPDLLVSKRRREPDDRERSCPSIHGQRVHGQVITQNNGEGYL